MSKRNQTLVENACHSIYQAGGYTAVIAHVEAEKKAGNSKYADVKDMPCRACDNDMPSLNGICLVCGQPVAKVRYNIWVEIERVEEYDDDEIYRDEDNPLKIGIRDTLEDAVSLQELVREIFGEI